MTKLAVISLATLVCMAITGTTSTSLAEPLPKGGGPEYTSGTVLGSLNEFLNTPQSSVTDIICISVPFAHVSKLKGAWARLGVYLTELTACQALLWVGLGYLADPNTPVLDRLGARELMNSHVVIALFADFFGDEKVERILALPPEQRTSDVISQILLAQT